MPHLLNEEAPLAPTPILGVSEVEILRVGILGSTT